MNYLAHTALSCNDESLLLGNFLTDLVTHKESLSFPKNIYAGVKLHRKIDNFTDSHYLIRCFVMDLIPDFGKISPVVGDIFFDHILANNWNSYMNRNFKSFQKDVYEKISNNYAIIPTRILPKVKGMVEAGWLAVYHSNKGIKEVFKNLAVRAPQFEKPLSLAHLYLHDNYENIENIFNHFFPELKDFVEKECVC